MKSLFFFLLCSIVSFGQFTYEYDYFGENAKRIVLENSGEKYYSTDRFNHNVKIFNANHSLWKTINVNTTGNTNDFFVNHISENKINNDNLIEISCTYSISNIFYSKIVNELGLELLSLTNCNSLNVNEQVGQPIKIISNSYPSTVSNIYSVPNFLLEQSYIGETSRIKLENSGVKYYNFDNSSGIISIYNSDHSVWKSITLNKPIGYIYSGVKFLSENQINNDNLIEVAYGYFINGSNPAQYCDIINENGTTLLSLNNATNLVISSVDGLPNKLKASLYNNSTQIAETQIYSCPNLNLEHTYNGNIDRVYLELSGEKYYDKKNNFNPSIPIPVEVIIYNSDHTIWKTIAIPFSNPVGPSMMNVFATETKFNSDSLLELSFSISANTLNGGGYQSYILNEDGSIFFTVPNSYGFYLSEIPSLPTKFIIYRFYNFGFPNTAVGTTICNMGGVFSVNNFNLSEVTIFPNPASDFVHIKSQNNSITKALIYDLQGKIIQEFEGENLEIIDINKLVTGLYMIKLIDNNENAATYKFEKTKN